MEALSFNTYIQNCKNKAQTSYAPESLVQTNDIKLKTELKTDTVQLSNKKTNNKTTLFKKTALTAAAIGTVVAGCVTIAKVKNLEKIKKEVTALYDTIFEAIQAKNQNIDFNFEKPKLVFASLKDAAGQYEPNTNRICINTKALKKFYVPKNLKKVDIKTVSESLELAVPGYAKIDRYADGYRKTTQNERILNIGSSLYHELTHAKQFQIALSTEGGKEQMIEGFKKAFPKLTEKEFKNTFPFLYSYKPKQLLPKNVVFGEKVQGGTTLQYGLGAIVEAFTDYTSKDKLKYYTNLTEISARKSEVAYWKGVINGKFPRPEGISDELLGYFWLCAENNVKSIVDALSKA